MATKSSIRKDPKQLDTTTKQTKMITIRRRSSMTAKRRKVTIRNMAASTNTTIPRKVNTRKEKRKAKATMKGIKVRYHDFDSKLQNSRFYNQIKSKHTSYF